MEPLLQEEEFDADEGCQAREPKRCQPHLWPPKGGAETPNR